MHTQINVRTRLGSNVRASGVSRDQTFEPGCVGLLTAAAASRFRRATELRVFDVRIKEPESRALWARMAGTKVNLVPVRVSSPGQRARKAAALRASYKIEGPLTFVHGEEGCQMSPRLPGSKCRG